MSAMMGATIIHFQENYHSQGTEFTYWPGKIVADGTKD